MWVLTKLKTGDTLASLAKKYDVGVRQIVQENGIVFTTPSVNNWVISTGGKWLPQIGEAVEGSPTGGWAVFTSASEILLPAQKTACACKKSPTKYIVGGVLAGIALDRIMKGR